MKLPLRAAWTDARISQSAWLCGAWCLFAALFVLLAMTELVPSTWLTLLVAAPVLEETIFRWGLQERLLRFGGAEVNSGVNRLGGAPRLAPWLANLLTALVFSAAHCVFNPGEMSGLTVLPALALGWVYQTQRRLWPCVALHGAFNALWLLSGAAA